MTKKINKKETPKKEKVNKLVGVSKIVDVKCTMKIRKNALLIEYNDITYVTNKELLKELVEGTLKIKKGTTTRRKGSKAKSLRLNILKDGSIIDIEGIFLTKKDKSFYLSIDNDLLITPVSSVEKLVSGEYTYVKMGLFQ